MFDLEAQDGSVRKRRRKSPIAESPAPQQERKTEPLDSDEATQTHHRLLDNYTRELDRQHENRLEMAIDEDFYDSIQWREADAAVLEERGQVPLVYNVISSSVDWVLGTEKRTKTDYKILPRRKPEARPAERKSQLLKYLSDVNRTGFHVSRAFEDAVKAGIGWIEDGWNPDEEEEIYCRYESWRNVLWDSASVEPDLKDARYLFRSKWLDLDILKSLFPKRTGLIDRSGEGAGEGFMLDSFGDEAMDSQEMEMTGGWGGRSDRYMGYDRRRARTIEGWYRVPTEADVFRNGPFKGEVFDQYSRGHVEAWKSREGEVRQRRILRMHVAIFTTGGLLYKGVSPYRHNRFPLTPVWGKRRGRDNLPYGIIRSLRGMQEDINKRASKALWQLSTNRIVMDEGAVDDIDATVEEAARPDGVIVKKNGKELRLEAGADLAQYQLELMSRTISLIQTSSGVTDELLGRRTNAQSGIAIEARQSQGSMATASFFENLRLARQVSGEKKLSLLEQFMSEPKAFRITDQRGNPDYIEINDGLPDNDLVRTKADFIIDEADWNATLRQAAVAELLGLMKILPPEVILVMLDLLIDNMDLPNREEIARRIRKMTAQRDPDQEEPTEEEIAAAQAQAQEAEFQNQLRQAGLEKLMAETRRTLAQADQAEATATKQNIGALGGPKRGAIDIAAELVSVPGLADPGDAIMREAWFQPRSEKEAPPPQQPVPGI